MIKRRIENIHNTCSMELFREKRFFRFSLLTAWKKVVRERWRTIPLPFVCLTTMALCAISGHRMRTQKLLLRCTTVDKQSWCRRILVTISSCDKRSLYDGMALMSRRNKRNHWMSTLSNNWLLSVLSDDCLMKVRDLWGISDKDLIYVQHYVI